MSWLVVPRRDRFPAQVERAFAALFERGFVVADRSRFRMGETLTLATGGRVVHLDSDGDSRTIDVRIERRPAGDVPALRLDDVTWVLAPDLLGGRRGLPRLVREADRAPHLEYWAGVLEAVVAPWLDGDDEWWDRTAPLVAEHVARTRWRVDPAEG